MNDEFIIAMGSFIVMAIAIIKPILNLNTSIIELKSSIDSFKDALQDLKQRTTKHGEELDKVHTRLADHEARISNLER